MYGLTAGAGISKPFLEKEYAWQLRLDLPTIHQSWESDRVFWESVRPILIYAAYFSQVQEKWKKTRDWDTTHVVGLWQFSHVAFRVVTSFLTFWF